jgi:hypothetical protein
MEMEMEMEMEVGMLRWMFGMKMKRGIVVCGMREEYKKNWSLQK